MHKKENDVKQIYGITNKQTHKITCEWCGEFGYATLPIPAKYTDYPDGFICKECGKFSTFPEYLKVEYREVDLNDEQCFKEAALGIFECFTGIKLTPKSKISRLLYLTRYVYQEHLKKESKEDDGILDLIDELVIKMRKSFPDFKS